METVKSRPRIMMVDDVPENLELLQSILSSDYSLESFSDSLKALDHAFATPPPDLVLLDIVMPELDGFEFCRLLKAAPAYADIPVIFITALDDAIDEQKGLSLGAADYIRKPFSAPVVIARVKTHVKIKLLLDFLREEIASLQNKLNHSSSDLVLLKKYIWAAQLARHGEIED